MALLRDGYRSIVGVDEVGRGAWAGPVVAAAVSIPPGAYSDHSVLRDADDSKRVPARRRLTLVTEINAVASVAVGWVDPFLTDAVGASEATFQAMRVAIGALASTARDGAIEGPGWHARRTSGPPVIAEVLLVDGYPLGEATAPQRAIVRGDRECLAIACASLAAKVARDSFMASLQYAFPAYRFDRHVGYGTRDHFRALLAHGLTPLHRRRFQPMRHIDQCLNGGAPRVPSLPPTTTVSPTRDGQLDFLRTWSER